MASSGTKGLLMDTKIKQLRTDNEPKKTPGSSYLQGLKDEFKKISWTTKEELKFCTKVTVGAMFVFGIGIYCVDLLIKGAVLTLGSFFHLIFG